METTLAVLGDDRRYPTENLAMKLRFLLPLCFIFALQATLRAEDGLLTAVGPFAVYVEFEGPDPKVQKKTCDAIYSLLRKARFPTVEPRGLENEVSPFLHVQMKVRRVKSPEGILFTAQTSVKVPTTNPFNGTPMHGLLTSGFAVEFMEDSEKADDIINSYLTDTVTNLIKSWRSQNPLSLKSQADSLTKQSEHGTIKHSFTEAD